MKKNSNVYFPCSFFTRNEQKEYTKNEIRKYSEEIEDLWFKINKNSLFAFLGTALAITIFAIEPKQQEVNETIENLIGITSAATTVVNATSCVKKIVNREALKHTIRMLEHDLAMSTLQEKPKIYRKENKENHG